MSQPNVADVARIAQVSRQTVSNVINTPGIVKPATRIRVEAAIAKLGYRPNLSARRLRQQKSATLGIRLDPMMNGISGAVLDRFLHALTEQADARGLRILLFTAATPEAEIEQIRRLREAAEVDAFVLTATFHQDPRTEWLIENRIPFVTFGRPWGIDDMTDPQHLWVDVNGRQGVYDATISLLDQGVQRVGWLGWPRPSGTGDDRRSGWEDAMRERLGLGDDQLRALCIESHDGVPQSTAAVVATLVAGRAAALADGGAGTGASADEFGLEALVCASDTLALGALIATSSAGLRDLPIIGFDDTPVAAAVGLSSVMQPLAEVAAGALDLLMGPTGNTVGVPNLAPNEAHRLIAPRLVERRSNHLPLSEPSPSLTR